MQTVGFFVTLSVFVVALDCWQQYHETGECPVGEGLRFISMCMLVGACSLLFWWENLVRIIGIGRTIRWGTTPAALDAEAVCAICMEPMAVSSAANEGCLLRRLTAPPALRTLCCTHTFHSGCIERWVARNPSCPLCGCAVLRAYWIVFCAAVEQVVLCLTAGAVLFMLMFICHAVSILNDVD